MHIGIDGRFTQGPNTGVTNYLLNLLKSLSRVDTRNTYSIFLSNPNYDGRIPDTVNFRVKVNTVNAFMWKNAWLPKEVKKEKIDVVHFPAYTGSFVNLGPNVVTIHDLIHKVNPSWFSYRELMLIDFPIKLAIKKAMKIIAVSESTKRDIIKFYNVKEDKIVVTLEAADASFEPTRDLAKLDYIKKKYAIGCDYILYVGVLFKRRNIDRLLEAFSLLKRKQHVKHKLVLVGPGKEYFHLNNYIEKYGIKDEVIYLGYVEQDDLPLLYNASSFFVYPSLYEGFGLPVLEGMACGKAVITSNVSSLPEVIGDTGLLIDPYDVEELCDAMYRLCQDDDLKENLGRRALERSKIFSWDKMARETLAVYKEFDI